MKSLLSNSCKDSIKEKLNYFEPFVSAAKKAAELEENSFLDITGIKGCLNSYFIREYFKFNSAKWLNQLKYNAAGYSSKALQGAGSQGGVVIVGGGTAAAGTQGAATGVQPVVIGAGTAAAVSPTGQITEAVADAAEAGVAAVNAAAEDGQMPSTPLSIPRDADAEQLAAIIRAANDELLHRAQAVLSPEMEDATKVYIEKLRTLTDTFAKVDEQSAKLTRDSEEMENLNRTLTGINKVYELHLKSISLQVGTIDEINNQTHKLSEQIQHLNQVYGRMIEALTVNMPRGAAPTEG